MASVGPRRLHRMPWRSVIYSTQHGTLQSTRNRSVNPPAQHGRQMPLPPTRRQTDQLRQTGGRWAGGAMPGTAGTVVGCVSTRRAYTLQPLDLQGVASSIHGNRRRRNSVQSWPIYGWQHQGLHTGLQWPYQQSSAISAIRNAVITIIQFIRGNVAHFTNSIKPTLEMLS